MKTARTSDLPRMTQFATIHGDPLDDAVVQILNYETTNMNAHRPEGYRGLLRAAKAYYRAQKHRFKESPL